jgi:deazaflavin-dependent oxidoreductase (nitroreductase family)
MRWLRNAHRWVYRFSRGRVLGRLVGLPVLLLTTVGRRSGEARTTPLTYLPHGGAFVVVASNGGRPRHPAWFLNLRAMPRAEVMVGARHLRVAGREAADDERARLWAEIVQRWPGYARYERRTTRRIPVVVLEPEP